MHNFDMNKIYSFSLKKTIEIEKEEQKMPKSKICTND